MTYRKLLRESTIKLKASGIYDAEYDAFALMENVFGISKTDYLINGNLCPDDDKIEKYNQMLELRANHTPLQHIIGNAWFYGRNFVVSKDVLIPRQDTEVLVEEALNKIKYGRVLDMCTGSGCILLSILLENPSLEGVGVDISKEALEIANENAKRLCVSNAKFLHGDLFDAFDVYEKFDMIVSNPPYIKTEEIETLDEEVKCHDPILALDGHEDGLYFYRKIVTDAISYLRCGGHLIFEIGYNQGNAVSELMQHNGFEDVCIKKDLAGLDRVVYGKYCGK